VQFDSVKVASIYIGAQGTFKSALQLLMNRYGKIRFAQVPERVSTQSFVGLIIGNSKSNHLGAQGTFNDTPLGLYNIFFHLFVCVQESVIHLSPPPICITHTTAILL